jgi:hypothetical protein
MMPPAVISDESLQWSWRSSTPQRHDQRMARRITTTQIVVIESKNPKRTARSELDMPPSQRPKAFHSADIRSEPGKVSIVISEESKCQNDINQSDDRS